MIDYKAGRIQKTHIVSQIGYIPVRNFPKSSQQLWVHNTQKIHCDYGDDNGVGTARCKWRNFRTFNVRVVVAYALHVCNVRYARSTQSALHACNRYTNHLQHSMRVRECIVICVVALYDTIRIHWQTPPPTSAQNIHNNHKYASPIRLIMIQYNTHTHIYLHHIVSYHRWLSAHCFVRLCCACVDGACRPVWSPRVDRHQCLSMSLRLTRLGLQSRQTT